MTDGLAEGMGGNVGAGKRRVSHCIPANDRNSTTGPRYEGGSSTDLLDRYVEAQVSIVRPSRVVDFGPGQGKMGRLCRNVIGRGLYILGIEAYHGVIEQLKTGGIYNEVYEGLLQTWVAQNHHHFDLAIFGDVLEHLPRRQVAKVLNRTLTFTDNIIVNVPLMDIRQDAFLENPLEEHKGYLTEGYFDRRYILMEKHVVNGRGEMTGRCKLNAWIIGRRYWRTAAMAKHCLLFLGGRRMAKILRHFGYNAYVSCMPRERE